MTVGYPDYARLSNQGGYLLYRTSGSPPENTVLFQGYVGLWPYINMFTSMNVSSDFCQIQLSYFADESFTTLTGFRYAVRTGGSFAITQYGNISPWLRVSYITESGNPISFQEWSIYGTTGYSPQVQMTSLDVPIISINQNVAAASSVTLNIQHIQPGSANFNFYSGATSWYYQFKRYDWDSSAYVIDGTVNSGTFGNAGVVDFPMLDAPYQLLAHNSDAASNSFIATWKSV